MHLSVTLLCWSLVRTLVPSFAASSNEGKNSGHVTQGPREVEIVKQICNETQ